MRAGLLDHIEALPATRPLPRLRLPIDPSCGMCGQPYKVDFTVPDAIWPAIVPAELQHNVVCLYCFDELAHQAGAAYLSDIDFFFLGRADACDPTVVPLPRSSPEDDAS